MPAAPSQHPAIMIRTFQLADAAALSHYLYGLSSATKERFAPHGFSEEEILQLYQNPSSYLGYLALDAAETIIAYTVVKIGLLPHEAARMEQYGFCIHPLRDVLLAPSVADAWQGSGIGTSLMQQLKKELSSYGIQRIFLWGGVQETNTKAIAFYEKHAFTLLGVFEYKGNNRDMVCSLA